MIAIKRLGFVSFFLLTACAPPPPAMDAPLNPGVTTGTETPLNKGIPTKPGTVIVPGTATGKATLADSKNTAKLATVKGAPPVDSKALATGSPATRISSWDLSGSMAARSKNKGWSASINWTQRGAGQYQIRMSGPLGSGTVIINKQGGVVTYRDGPKTASSSNADELLKRTTGVRLPVNSLYYWVRGIPAPGAVQSAKREGNRLLVLRQGGYTIEYSQYTSVGGIILPSSIRLQGNGVFIKLIIRNWRI